MKICFQTHLFGQVSTVLEQFQGIKDQLVEFKFLHIGLFGSCKKEKIVDQMVQSAGLPQDDVHEAPIDIIFIQSLPEHLKGSTYGGHWISHFVGYPCRKFTDQGHVKLAVQQQSRGVWALVVSDTGVGIPSHAQEYIFDEFRQMDGTSRREYGGSGLGLAIVRNLSMMMGGNVRVHSQVGEGSRFTVLLPLVTEEEIDHETDHLDIQKV